MYNSVVDFFSSRFFEENVPDHYSGFHFLRRSESMKFYSLVWGS